MQPRSGFNTIQVETLDSRQGLFGLPNGKYTTVLLNAVDLFEFEGMRIFGGGGDEIGGQCVPNCDDTLRKAGVYMSSVCSGYSGVVIVVIVVL